MCLNFVASFMGNRPTCLRYEQSMRSKQDGHPLSRSYVTRFTSGVTALVVSVTAMMWFARALSEELLSHVFPSKGPPYTFVRKDTEIESESDGISMLVRPLTIVMTSEPCSIEVTAKYRSSGVMLVRSSSEKRGTDGALRLAACLA